MRNLLKLSTYLIATCLFVVVFVEILLRLTFSDPDYYWHNRFLFVSPDVYQNHDAGFWTYRPHATIREVAVYGMPAPFTALPKIFVEYDCLMKSNNLGLLQDNDIKPGSSATVIVGDSFTAGQGGCPWFDRLQARRKSDDLVNSGLMGTGFGHWMRLIKYLQQRGVTTKRLLVIAISLDFRRTAWVWPQIELDCLDYKSCPAEDSDGLSLPIGIEESHSDILQRSAVRFRARFGHLTWYDASIMYLRQNVYVAKFSVIAFENVKAMIKRTIRPGSAGTYPVAEEALDSFKSLGIPLRVLLVNQKDEVEPFGNRRGLEDAIAVLNAHGVAYSRCYLAITDFMPYDGHPNRAGYDKLVSCADKVLKALN